MRFNYFIFIVLSILTSSSANISKAVVRIQEQKLNYNTLFSDEHNNLWIGCETGLFQWKNYETRNIPLSIPLHITAIGSMNGTLILGTKSGKVYTYNKNQKQLKLVGDMKAEISSIARNDNSICIASKGKGFITVSPYEIHKYTTQSGLPDNFIYQIQFDKSNAIWSSSDNGIVKSTTPAKHNAFFFTNKLNDKLITCFDKKDNMLFCGTQRGDIYKINLTDSSIELFNNDLWHKSQLNAIKVLDRSIAIATDLGAYYLDFSGKPLETVISGKAVKSIEKDGEANIWFCGESILISSTGEQISLIQTLGGNKISNVHTLIIDSNQTLYFTPDQGLAKYNFQHQTFKLINITGPKDSVDITSLYIDKHGSLWLGTMGKGLFKIDTANLHSSQIPVDSSVESSGILHISAKFGTIWVTSLNGIWCSQIEQKPYSFYSFEEVYHQKKHYVYQIEHDNNGNKWLATDGQGILKIQNHKISTFSQNKNINTSVFYSIESDGAGQIWFNAYNDGLYCLRGDSLVHLSISNGLSSNEISSFVKYKKDYILAVMPHNIDLINIHNFMVTHINFEYTNSNILAESNSICADNQDNVFIGTNVGILKVFVPSYKLTRTAKAIIEGIQVMDKNNPRKKNVFKSDENYFRFKISSNFTLEQSVYYRYKLEGLNENWNLTIDNEVLFPRLNEGKYNFVLESANNPDFMNASQDNFSFIIESPFWKRSWFIVLLLSTISIALIYYIRFREKRISRVEQLEKEKAIAEFETLKHQVSPHFLFNSFNTLIQVIDEDKEKAIEYTQMLSDFYRSLVSYRDVDLVTLEEELKLLEKYIYLQKMRFGDSLILVNACTEIQQDEILIPPLTLQILAENAIKHNTISISKPLQLSISISKKGVLIANNMNAKMNKEEGESIGHHNIKNRFKLFTSKAVEISQANGQFEVLLPILNHKNN